MFLDPISWNYGTGRVTRFEGDLRFACKCDLHGRTDLGGGGHSTGSGRFRSRSRIDIDIFGSKHRDAGGERFG